MATDLIPRAEATVRNEVRKLNELRKAAAHAEQRAFIDGLRDSLKEGGFNAPAAERINRGQSNEVRYFKLRGWGQKWPCEEVWVARRRIAD